MAFAWLVVFYVHLVVAFSWSVVLKKSTDPLFVILNSTISEEYTHNNVTIATSRRNFASRISSLSPADIMSEKVDNTSIVVDDLLNRVVHSSMKDMLSKLSQSLRKILRKLKRRFGSLKLRDSDPKLGQLLNTTESLRLMDAINFTRSTPITQKTLGQLASLLTILESRSAVDPLLAAENTTNNSAPTLPQRRSSISSPGEMKRPAAVMEVPVQMVLERTESYIKGNQGATRPDQNPNLWLPGTTSIPSGKQSVVVEILPPIKKKDDSFLRFHDDLPEEPVARPVQYPSVSLVTVATRAKTHPNRDSVNPAVPNQPVRTSTKFLIETLSIAVGAVFAGLVIGSVVLIAILYRKSRRPRRRHWPDGFLPNKFVSMHGSSQISGQIMRDLSVSSSPRYPMDSNDREVETFAYAHSMPRSAVHTLRPAQDDNSWTLYP